MFLCVLLPTTIAVADSGGDGAHGCEQILAFILGLVQQNVYITLWVGLGGTALAFLMVVPPWPIYNENPENWLPSRNGLAGTGIEVDGKKIN